MFLVATGTAANALALAHLTPPWGAVLCHDEAHIAIDECGAPEFYGGGIKLIGLAGEAGKIAPATLRHALDAGQWGGPHHVSPAVLSLSQATEAGTIYRPDEIRELADIAHGRGMAVHVDGARLGNALARMNASPAQATWQAGVDVLSFGATKGGALAAEAIVFFDPARGANMSERRKRGGHLVSKHRFVAAQIEAYLANDLWLKLARHANAMADRLAAGLLAAGLLPGLAGRGQRGVRRAAAADRRAAQGGGSELPSLDDGCACRKVSHCRAMQRSCASSPRSQRRWMKSIVFWQGRVLREVTPAPKLRPIPGYRYHTQRVPRTSSRSATRRRSGPRSHVRAGRASGVVLKQTYRALRGAPRLCATASARRSGAGGASRLSRSCPSRLRGGIAAP